MDIVVKVMDEHSNLKSVKLTFKPWLTFKTWLKLKIFGVAYVFHGKREGWKGELPFYVVKCPRCKQLFLDYPHGYENYFVCPNCYDRTA